MTKKEKEVFRVYQDMISDDLFEAMEHGNEQSLMIAQAKFNFLHKLYSSLRDTEQGA